MRSRSEREIVLDILTRIRREQTYSHVAIREALDAAEESSMTTQQRAFIKRLTEGVIERRPELDEVIGRHTRKGTRIKPVIRD
ncbi:MAG: transcription antitermination factor NusB, partial [Eubacteriales bacterium]|nr:transcription antitermination factor NusB [Eubacteriales bacterium]